MANCCPAVLKLLTGGLGCWLTAGGSCTGGGDGLAGRARCRKDDLGGMELLLDMAGSLLESRLKLLEMELGACLEEKDGKLRNSEKVAAGGLGLVLACFGGRGLNELPIVRKE